MRKRTKYTEGETIGCCTFIMETEPDNYSRRAVFKCRCGNEFETHIVSVKMFRTKSCGCIKPRRVSETHRKHSASGHKYYTIYAGILARCFNHNSSNYKYYGKKGIGFYNKWRMDPWSFFKYIGSLNNAGKPGFSIDRIDNNVGYYPGNIRWAQNHTQGANRGLLSNNTSGYTGVISHPHSKYMAVIKINNKRIYIGAGATPKIAALKRDFYIIKNGLDGYPLQVLKR